MNKWIKILLGLIFVVIPLYLVLPSGALESWGNAALELIKGTITISIILIGIVLIILGISELKE